MSETRRFDDLGALIPLAQMVHRLDPEGPPEGRIVAMPRVGHHSLDSSRLRRIGVLSGSFNPLHDAHVALANHARTSRRLDAVFYCLSKRTVDKERVTGLGLTDRLHLLQLHCASQERLGVLFVNRGLYVDQAQIVRACLPALRDLRFLIGYDKLVQIFDPRYYDDRDAALDELFRLAHLLVAPRGTADREEIANLLAQPENRRFASRVEVLELPVALRDVSSSEVRAAIASGNLAGLPIPDLARAYVAHVGAYAAPLRLPGGEVVDRAELRDRLIDAIAFPESPAGAALRQVVGEPVDLEALEREAISDSSTGQQIRRLLALATERAGEGPSP